MTGITAVVALGILSVGPWTLQESGTRARLRGVSAVGPKVAWASGSGGTCVRTTDGSTWTRIDAPDGDKLDFRDVHAFDGASACLLAIGPGELSRIYRTADGGKSWTLAHLNRDPKGFLDAIAFWDRDRGIALGDPVDGRFLVLTTDDGGRSWSRIPASGMPEALPGEGAFAASGTCLAVEGESDVWFGTGGGKSARVFRSTDRGRTWAVAEVPIRAGIASAGVFSLAFVDEKRGVAVGGDYRAEADPTGNIATTDDGGKTWTPVEKSRPGGFRSAVAYVPGTAGKSLVAVGPSGSDRSNDGGLTWSPIDGPGFHALGFGDPADSGWAVGEGGRIGRLDRPETRAK